MGVYDSGQQITLAAKFGTNLTELAVPVAALATTVTVLDVTGYAATGIMLLDADTDSEEIRTIASVAGNVVTLSAALAYSHADDTPVMLLADPTTVTLRLTDPLGVVTVYTYALVQIIRDALGRYHVLITPMIAGVYLTRWEGTGTVVTAAEDDFTVRGTPPVVYRPATRGYTTPDEVAVELGITFTAEQEARCYQLIVEAEAYIDRFTGRSWLGPSPATEDVVVWGGQVRLQSYPVANIVAITGVTKEVGWLEVPEAVTATEYRIIDATRGLVAFPYHEGRTLHITYTHDGPMVPALVSRAARLYVAGALGPSLPGTDNLPSDVKSYSVGGEYTLTRYDPHVMAMNRYTEVEQLLYSFKRLHFA